MHPWRDEFVTLLTVQLAQDLSDSDLRKGPSGTSPGSSVYSFLVKDPVTPQAISYKPSLL